ncbi:MAG TPA: hypothetical protein VFP98_10465 [Candidatus Polarisedimenticolia bacterium]|nr:hypothetical protein [Candidatus Polarisedimenticolia bacterium]
MKTVGEFLQECGARLAPFDRVRVGKAGCGASLAAMAVAGLALGLGLFDAHGSWARGFRIVVLSGIGAALALFLVYAVLESVVEKSVRRGIDTFVKEGGSDLETLVKAAEIRRGHMAGGHRLAEVLKQHAPGA